ncbi:MAG: membrane protein insertase YidC [Propionicimonas sp.]
MNLLPLLLPLGLWEDFLGLLNTMMQPLYWAVSGLLVMFHSLLSNVMDPDSGWTWALSIVLLTVMIRTALIPLFVRQINSSRNMQLLSPKLKELNEKYSHDREKLGQETMKLYKDEGVNPMASCFPVLLQMPIFLSLFYVLLSASNGVALGYWFETNPELVSSLQHATIFGAEISARFVPMTSWGAVQTLTLILIILMTGVLFVTQLQLMRKNMPPEALTGQMAQQQKMMLYMFPAMYAIGGINIPIGVLIYWLTTNLWTMVQQYILIHNNPAPGTPAYVDWEERMRAAGKDPDEISAKRRGAKKRTSAASDYDPTKVARQSTTRPTGTAPNAGSPGGTATTTTGSTASTAGTPAVGDDSSNGSDRTVVQRQQPKRNARAKRKS